MKIPRAASARGQSFPSPLPIVRIQNGTFYRHHPSSPTDSNPPLFPNLHFSLPSAPIIGDASNGTGQQHWAVIGTHGATTFLEILCGQHVCVPPNARSFPYLGSKEIEAKNHRLRSPSRAVQYMGFASSRDKSKGIEMQGLYLSARYESRREQTDWSLMQYLRGETELNPAEESQSKDDSFDALLFRIIHDLRLEPLISLPLSNLSNGQRRRALIAEALLSRPELLLLDEPFMGLDPPTLVSLSPMLRELAHKSSPRLLLSLRPQDPIPDWITHLAIIGSNHRLALVGSKAEVMFATHRWLDGHCFQRGGDTAVEMARKMTAAYGAPPVGVGSTLSNRGVDVWKLSSTILSSRSPCYLDVNGEVVPEHLDPADLDLWSKASGKSRQTTTLNDLLVLTCLLPQDVKAGIVYASTKQPSLKGGLGDASVQSPGNKEVATSRGDSLVEVNGAIVSYGSKTVLGQGVQSGFSTPGLNITIRKGTRLAILGPNGSGKTTLLSLITSDHPQSYSSPIKFFGQSRLPSRGQPGLSFWQIQSRIGHSSPEVHAFVPRGLTIRRTLESAWADTFAAKPEVSEKQQRLVDVFLRWWEPELNPSYRAAASPEPFQCPVGDWILASYPPVNQTANDLEWATSRKNSFGTLSFESQRLLLFLRAIIKCSEVVILDEAFSGLSAFVRDKALLFLEAGQKLVLRQQTFPAHGRGQESGDSTNSAEDKLPNRRVEVEWICSKSCITIDDLYADWRSLPAKTEAIRKQLSNMTAEQLSALAADEKPSSLGYLFTGLTSSQALLIVSHVREEIPATVDEYLRLPGRDEVSEKGKCAELGRCEDGSIRTVEGWNRIWGL